MRRPTARVSTTLVTCTGWAGINQRFFPPTAPRDTVKISRAWSPERWAEAMTGKAHVPTDTSQTSSRTRIRPPEIDGPPQGTGPSRPGYQLSRELAQCHRDGFPAAAIPGEAGSPGVPRAAQGCALTGGRR